MNRQQVEALAGLFQKRAEHRSRLASLRSDPRTTIEIQFVVGGVSYRLPLDKPYIAAQWTAALHDVERRIRAAGGAL